MFLLGLAILLIGVGFFITVLGGSIIGFINIPALSLIILALLGVLTATQSFQVFSGGLRAAIFPKEEITEELRGRAASLFRLLSKTVAMAIVIGMAVNFIGILENLDFADARGVAYLGVNIAVAFLTPFWGMIFIAGVFEPVVFILKKRQGTGRKQ